MDKKRLLRQLEALQDEIWELKERELETLEELEVKLNESCEQLKSLPKPKQACEYSDDNDDDLFFDLGLARFNLCSFIENLEWKIDLKLFYAKSCLSD